jgi:hypothetical protein
VDDCRDLIPEGMHQRGLDNKIMRNRQLESYKGLKWKGELLELLYELARITGSSQKDAAWIKIRKRWDSRPAGTQGNKAITAGDVKHAIEYFRNQDGGEGESSSQRHTATRNISGMKWKAMQVRTEVKSMRKQKKACAPTMDKTWVKREARFCRTRSSRFFLLQKSL